MAVDLAWVTSQFPDLTAIALLGQGGQKLVYSARHAIDGDVVLKLIQPNSDPEAVRREIIAAQKVASARVPAIHQHGTVMTVLGECFWVRERRIMGRTLREVLQAGALPPDRVLGLVVQMLEALAVAESVQLVHRDVKPENIIRDLVGDFWLLDFGIARHLDLHSLTGDHNRWGKGTPGYASPEQMRNFKRAIDGRADLFGLGITAYESAVGTNPFCHGARDLGERIQRAESQPLPRLRIGLPKPADDELSDLVAAMTQKRRDQRPRSVAEALTWARSIGQQPGNP